MGASPSVQAKSVRQEEQRACLQLKKLRIGRKAHRFAVDSPIHRRQEDAMSITRNGLLILMVTLGVSTMFGQAGVDGSIVGTVSDNTGAKQTSCAWSNSHH